MVAFIVAATPAFAENANDPFQEVVKQYKTANTKPQIPEEARKYRVQAEFAVQEKRLDKAIELYGKALEIVPWWPEGHFNLALVKVFSLERESYWYDCVDCI